jgi:hypothetical protein
MKLSAGAAIEFAGSAFRVPVPRFQGTGLITQEHSRLIMLRPLVEWKYANASGGNWCSVTGQQSHVHHYVSQWYQRRFLEPGKSTYWYLDLHPETVQSGPKTYQRHALLHWGPARCFCKNDLYTIKLGNFTTDEIEKRFFGAADAKGKESVEFFASYNHDTDGASRHFQPLPTFMDAQRFRTPRGLEQLKRLTAAPNHNVTLLAMQRLFQLHTTMWVEGVWEIVRARQSPTKFIVSDEPVTFFNRHIFPSECVYPGGIDLDKIGTRTLFPLGPDACLIISHVQFVRDPWIKPLTVRENARSYDGTVKHLTEIQTGREIEEDEVLRINLILKARATRYIAASQEEWLYPERRVSTTDWSKLDDDWFLLPHLYKVSFVRETVVGFKNSPAWRQDEYGRRPTHPKFKDERQRSREWDRHVQAQQEWAKKRVGKSTAHIHPSDRSDVVADQMMLKYLQREGFVAPSEGDSSSPAA